MRKRLLAIAALAPAIANPVGAQTTQGLISGRILDSVSGRPVANGMISYSGNTLASSGEARSDSLGFYFIPLLSPGVYAVRAAADKYQPQEVHELELAVAGRIEIDFRLRPLSDVWEAGQYRSVFLPGSRTIVTFYGPDVDASRSGSFEGQQGKQGTLDTSQSYVIDPAQIRFLPLQGRDVYSMLVSLPGVTADSATGRGLGVSVAGARPSASNYLLDGVENDNYLITGPLNPVAPEAVEEYRISTNNYSAEYGRTAGFVANVITREGSNEFHGMAYEYFLNDALNAADFQDNLAGTGRLPDKENRFGYQAGGPGIRNRLFFSSALEQLISHGEQSPQKFTLPTTSFISILNLPPDRLARQLLQQYPAPAIDSPQLTGAWTASAPVVVDRLAALERGDYVMGGGRDHIMGRLNIARLGEPDFIWSPYAAFTSGLNENTTGFMANWMRSWTPRLTSELKIGYSDDDLWWNRAHPEIPTLVSNDGVTLPGSPAFYAYRNRNRSIEPIYSAVWTRNRHVITAGAGALARFNSGYLTAGRDGEYIFSGIIGFAFDQPSFFRASIDRLSATPVQPDFNRDYRYNQYFAFVEDSYRISSRLTLNYGLRYENFGAPANTGATKDALVELGPGSDFNSRLAAATLAVPAGSAETIFGRDNGDFAPRFGVSWDPLGKGKTVLRGAYGIYYDRPFDNLWQNVRNNNVVLPFYTITAAGTNYLAPIASALQLYAGQPAASNFPSLTMMDPKLRDGYAQQFFAGVQQSLGDNLSFEINGTGTLGRRLITTDIVNRQFTTLTGDGRPNEALPDISWRSGQGLSDYYALNTLARYRTGRFQFQAAYTWSHSIDNQSEPLAGDFFNLDFTAIGGSNAAGERSSFAQMFNSRGDRGNSDFDQRQNLFLLGIWRPEGHRWFSSGWEAGWMAAFRTGFPYSVYSVTTQAPVFGEGLIENQRADLSNPAAAFLSTPVAVPGGIQVLNPSAFAEPASASVTGNTGRNTFRGPGLYNLDISVGREFSLTHVRENAQLVLRADLFNILNHANLNNPANVFGAAGFGVETFGRQGVASGFPAVTPLNETARRIQLLVRVEF